MAGLAAKYDYLEKFTQKVSQTPEPKKRDYVPFRGSSGSEGGPPKKKQKKKQKPTKGNNTVKNEAKLMPKSIKKSTQKQNNTAVWDNTQKKAQHVNEVNGQQVTGGAKPEDQFNAVDILRKRLHQKIEESRGQGPPKDPFSEEVRKKRERRRQERERKKKKRKEFRMKQLVQSASEEEKNKTPETPAPPSKTTTTKPAKKDESSIVFNKVEVGDDYTDKGTQLTEKNTKKRRVKSSLTPLTGRNYKQLLSRVESRKARLEELRETDEKKAKKEEEKMRWSNVLYKAEGLKIKDNEDLLRASLKRKEKRKAQHKRQWAQRSQNLVQKMQQRQDKRRRNILKRKQGKDQKKKERARRKGRVLPEDLKKAAV